MNDRVESLDFMKFFCALAVVCIHTNPFKEYGNIGVIIKVLCRIGVPFFFLCSGYLLGLKRDRKYFKKYFVNILKIFISWSLFYIILSLSLQSVTNIFNGKTFFAGYKEYLSGFSLILLYYPVGIIKYHLWYLSALIVIIPILYIAFKYDVVRKILIFSLILNLIGVILLNFGITSYVRDALFFGLFYCILGMYININEDNIKNKFSKVSNLTLCLIIIILFFIMICESMIYNYFFKTSGDYYFSTIPLAFCVFLICIKNKNIGKNSIINKIGKNSLGIYVAHVAIIELLEIILFKLNLESITHTIIWQIIYTPTVVFLAYVMYGGLHQLNIRLLKQKREKYVCN